VNSGRAHAVCGESGLLAAAHQLFEGQGCLCLAQKANARAQDLYEHQAIAEQNLEQAQSAEVQAGGDLAAAQAALKVMGITDPDALVKAPPSFEVPVKAPISGEVVEQDVSAGQLIQPGTTQCFMISDTSTVWVLVNSIRRTCLTCA
jgi:membrane fusion protein, heavy metal efflux system